MSADSLQTIKIEDGTVVFDTDMPIGSLRALSSATEGDLGKLIRAFAGLVTEWPFDGDPTDEAAWDLLRRSQFERLVGGIAEELGSLGEA